MRLQRVFNIADYLQPNVGEPFHYVVHEMVDATIVAWSMKPGQRITPNLRLSAQDSWTILVGEADDEVDANGRVMQIAVGDVVLAPTCAMHGVLNSGAKALAFVSIVCPRLSGFERV